MTREEGLCRHFVFPYSNIVPIERAHMGILYRRLRFCVRHVLYNSTTFARQASTEARTRL